MWQRRHWELPKRNWRCRRLCGSRLVNRDSPIPRPLPPRGEGEHCFTSEEAIFFPFCMHTKHTHPPPPVEEGLGVGESLRKGSGDGGGGGGQCVPVLPNPPRVSAP